MCTLSWKPLAGDGGYLLYFNRDELRSRQPASPPGVWQHNGIPFIAPRDTDRGGTWLLVNSFGLSFGLLNHYVAHSVVMKSAFGDAARSRGELALLCADCDSVEMAMDRVRQCPLKDYPPFHFFAANDQEAQQLTWTGTQCDITSLIAHGALLTTSSFLPEIIEPARRAIFADIARDMRSATPAELHQFHWYADDDGAKGVKMSRVDACTHSISRIRVLNHFCRIEFDYWPSAELQPHAHPTQCVLALLSARPETPVSGGR